MAFGRAMRMPVGLPPSSPSISPAGGLGESLRIADRSQGGPVQQRPIIEVKHEDRGIRRGLVQFVERRHPALGKLKLRPSAHDAHPLAGRSSVAPVPAASADRRRMTERRPIEAPGCNSGRHESGAGASRSARELRSACSGRSAWCAHHDERITSRSLPTARNLPSRIAAACSEGCGDRLASRFFRYGESGLPAFDSLPWQLLGMN